MSDFNQAYEQIKAMSGGLSQRRLEVLLGLRGYDIQNALAGTKAAQERFMDAARSQYGLPKEWPNEGVIPVRFPYRTKIRVVGAASAGPGEEPNSEEYELDLPIMPPPKADNGIFVVGSSLMPFIHPGDLLLFEPRKEWAYNRLMIVRREDGSLSAKTVIWKDGRTWLHSEDGTPDDDSNANPVGLVVMVIGMEKESFHHGNPDGLKVTSIPVRNFADFIDYLLTRYSK